MLFMILSVAIASQTLAADLSVCEIHVWQSKSYISGSPAPYAAYGLIGAILQSEHDSKYPANSVTGLMEYEMRPEALGLLIEAAPWYKYLGSHVFRAVIEPEVVDKARIKSLQMNQARNSVSNASCYAELYLSDQTFEGGFVKSHLFNNFAVRTFNSSSDTRANGIVWSELKQFPARDEATLPVATQNFREAFVKNLTKFLDKKLKPLSKLAP